MVHADSRLPLCLVQGEGVSCLYVVECGLLEATSAPTDEAPTDEATQGPTRTMLARGAMIGEVSTLNIYIHRPFTCILIDSYNR